MKKEPAKPELVKKILDEVKKNPNGIWIRKLSRNINEPTSTVYKYIIRKDYCGQYIKTEKRDRELGGNIIVKIKK